MLLLSFGASYFMIVFFDSLVKSDITAAEGVSTCEFRKQQLFVPMLFI
jgi:hypothetical protein